MTCENRLVELRRQELGVPRLISTRRIKDFVIRRLPPEHPLRDVILAERDTLTREEFLAKMEVWLLLLNRKV